MCTVIVSIQADRTVVAANRDEKIFRAWDSPAAWWPDRPGVVAGRDRTAGGTWMGVNRSGVMAAVLNRVGTLGPVAGKRSRGELPLMALEHASAEAAAAALGQMNAGDWRGFNMVLADGRGAIFMRGAGQGAPVAVRLDRGVHMITAHEPNDPDSPRVARHLHRFRGTPAPAASDWAGWDALLADRSGDAGEQINIVPRGDYGTVCSSLVELVPDRPPVWLFAAGAPHLVAFEAVRLAG